MAIAVHIANGNRDYCDLYRSSPASPVPMFRVPTVAACFTYFMSEVPQFFPKLRWGLSKPRLSGYLGSTGRWRFAIGRPGGSFLKTYSMKAMFLSLARRTTTSPLCS
jgi:hypothetical protein